MIYQRGDRRNSIARKYCEWLEKSYPQVYNRSSLISNKALATLPSTSSRSSRRIQQKQKAHESMDESMDTGDHSDSSDSSPSPQKKIKWKGIPGGIKASTRTNL